MTKKTKKSFVVKAVLWIFLLICIVILGGIAILPTYLSTPSGKTKLIEWIQHRISGKLSIDNLQLSWFSGQKIEGATLYDENGTKILAFETFITNKSLFQILFQPYTWGDTYLAHPYLLLVNEGDKKLNIEKVLSLHPKKPKTDKPSSWKFPTKGNLKIENGSLEMRALKVEPITLNQIFIHIEEDTPHHESVFRIQANTHQGTHDGDINLLGKISCCNPIHFDFSKELIGDIEKLGTILSIRMNSFPVALLDQLLTYDNPSITGTFVNAFGPTLEIDGEMKASSNEIQVDAWISSAFLKAKLLGHTEENIFSADPSSEITLTVTPASFEKLLAMFNPHSKWHLGNKTDINLSLETLTFPIPFEKKGLSFSLTGKVARAELSHEILGHVTIKNVSLSSSFSGVCDQFSLEYKGELQTPEAPSKFEGKILATHLHDEKGILSLEEASISFSTTFFAVPLDAIEVALRIKADLNPYLGNFLTFFCEGNIEKGKGEIKGKISSSLLETEVFTFVLDPHFALASPVNITYKITPTLFQNILPHDKELRITEGGVALLNLQTLTIPYSEKEGFLWDSTEMKLDLFLPSATIQGITYFSPISIQNVSGKIEIQGLKDIAIVTKGQGTLLDQKSSFNPLLGSQYEFSLSSKGEIFWKENKLVFPLSSLVLTCESERFTFDLQGSVDSEGLFSLSRPAKSVWTLSPEVFNSWAVTNAKNSPKLLEEAKMSITVDRLDAKLFPFDWHALKIESVMSLPKLIIQQSNITAQGALKNISMNSLFNGKKEEFTIHLLGQTEVITLKDGHVQTGDIKGVVELTNFLTEGRWSYENINMDMHLTANDFPIFIVDALTRKNGNLVTLLGSQLNFSLDATYNPKNNPQTFIILTAEGEGLKANIGFTLGSTFKMIQEHPGYIQWALTPARYHTLMFLLRGENRFPTSDYILLNTVPVSLTISELTCPSTISDLSFESVLCQSGFIGELWIGPMNLMNQVTRDHLLIQDTHAFLRGKDFSQAIQLNLSTHFRSKQEGEGSLSFKGDLINAWTPNGKWNKEKFSLKGNLEVQKLPIQPLLTLIPFSEQKAKEAKALLGENLNAKIVGEISALSGPLHVWIEASNLKASLPFYLQKGNLLLQDTLKAEITLTQEVSETFLVDINPLLVEAVRSEQPLHLFIEKEGFFLPMHPFSFKEVKIGKAVLDIGKIWVKNGGQLQALMDFVKAKNISPDGVMSAWFTPIFISLDQGVATYKRFDALLADNLHIAFWGQIDHNKGKVRMVLGISPTTLQQRFGILGLTKSDMFQIKMRGKVDDIQLDWSSAYSRIAIIIARTAGGPTGYIVGGLIELIGNALGEEPTPSPTTYPFPWQKKAPSKQGDAIPEEAHLPSGKGIFRRVIDFLIP